MISTQRYIRKPLYVDAVRVTAANFEEIAAWCQGDIQQEDIPGKGTSKKFIRVRVQNPKNPRQTKAFVGDWILYTETGYKVYTVKAFHAAFDKVEPKPETNQPVSTNGVSPPPTPIEEVAGVETETVVNRGEEREIEVAPALLEDQAPPLDAQVNQQLAEDGLPKYPEPQIEEATPEGIADAILQNEKAREDLEILPASIQEAAADSKGSPLSQVPAEPNKIQPDAVEGRQVLSVEEQQKMTAEEVRELVQSGDVVLAQDIAHP